ncbi:hypothetical protein EVAR_36420_1 [Eumeta japonica]|uniref:Uncharacterized protein n=1 Tax=Eumeta variegata TaxID=151549 RepID=A0A4C1VS94_EUMVA|nr:hypothetical protein EVAR_36420_1 [Eumeta japonica]
MACALTCAPIRVTLSLISTSGAFGAHRRGSAARWRKGKIELKVDFGIENENETKVESRIKIRIKIVAGIGVRSSRTGVGIKGWTALGIENGKNRHREQDREPNRARSNGRTLEFAMGRYTR